MTSEQFTYWLKGYVECAGGTFTRAQQKAVLEKLQTVDAPSLPEQYNPWPGTSHPYPPIWPDGGPTCTFGQSSPNV